MPLASSLIPGLHEIVHHSDSGRRADAVRRIARLFIDGASQFGADHVALFDEVLGTLAHEVDAATLGELAEQFAELANAPRGLIGRLARDEDIAIAGPLLRRSTLIGEPLLVELAGLRGQPHLMAIATRESVTPAVSDLIVVRGDGDVVRRLAGNGGADFSADGYRGLIKRAGFDDSLAITLGRRDGLPAPVLKELLANSVDVVRRRLFEVASPTVKIAINRAMGELAHAPRRPAVARDFQAAQCKIVTLHHGGRLDETALRDFATAHHYEEAVAALSALSGVRIPTLEQLLLGERLDPVLILGKSIGLQWPTVLALIMLRVDSAGSAAAPDIEEARQNFQLLAPATALRVLQFWRMRDAA